MAKSQVKWNGTARSIALTDPSMSEFFDAWHVLFPKGIPETSMIERAFKVVWEWPTGDLCTNDGFSVEWVWNNGLLEVEMILRNKE